MKLEGALFVLGAGLVAGGVATIYLPAAFILAGVVLVALAIGSMRFRS